MLFISSVLWKDRYEIVTPPSSPPLDCARHTILTTHLRPVRSNMKLSILATLVAGAAAFAPSTQGPQSTALNAQMGRKEFIAAASASVFAAAPLVANAGTMGQERVDDPTEV